jgi:hypothetical protein
MGSRPLAESELECASRDRVSRIVLPASIRSVLERKDSEGFLSVAQPFEKALDSEVVLIGRIQFKASTAHRSIMAGDSLRLFQVAAVRL